MSYQDFKRYAENYYRTNTSASWMDSVTHTIMAGENEIERFACEQRQEPYNPYRIKLKEI